MGGEVGDKDFIAGVHNEDDGCVASGNSREELVVEDNDGRKCRASRKDDRVGIIELHFFCDFNLEEMLLLCRLQVDSHSTILPKFTPPYYTPVIVSIS